ncbi:hypothetical protein V2J09_003242 [Rumex salicifolius]
MARSFSYRIPSIFSHLPSQKPSAAPLKPPPLSFAVKSPLTADSSSSRRSSRRPLIVFAIRCGGTSSLNAPLEPTSFPGRSLGGVLQNDPDSFDDAVFAELSRLSDDRDATLARMDLSLGSSEGCLHRRIAELKEEEYQTVVEDIMYMIVYQKFSQIRVPLVPSLDKCLYNGRLEILPSKDGELEAIHNLEVLEMIREYLTSVLGWKAGSNVTVNWAPTKIQRLHLSQVYAASIVYGYFLKSISIRHRLEHNTSQPFLKIIPSNSWEFLLGSGFYGIKSIALGEFSTPRSTTLSQVQHSHEKPPRKLKCYMEALDQEALQVCANMRSEITMDLVEKHCSALFVGENPRSVECDKPILTSLASLKRLVLEAIAFGCFLWDAEEYVDRVFKLEK